MKNPPKLPSNPIIIDGFIEKNMKMQDKKQKLKLKRMKYF